MKNQKKISVMIPCYNRSDLLAEALSSVMLQYDEELMDVWVVDDYSESDRPDAVVERLGKGKVRLHRHDRNLGQVGNLNACIDLAKGTLIHILHSDDRILPGFYKAIFNAYQQHPESGAYFCRNNLIDHNGNIIRPSEILNTTSGYIENWFEKIATSQLIQTPSIVVKKEVYERVGGFKKELSWTEDWEMWVRISKFFKIYYINEVLAEYRNATNSNSADSYISGRFILDLKFAINENYIHHQSYLIKKKSKKVYAKVILDQISYMIDKRDIKFKSLIKMYVKFLRCHFYNPYFHTRYMIRLIIWYLITKYRVKST